MAAPPGVELRVRPDQTKRWDFATVVRLYREQSAAWSKPIPGLVELPAPAAAGAKFTSVDLAAVANTDPFTAPFGVKKPGKFLFTGLKPGRQTAAGVPFEILDPAKNGGRGLVVLHSPHAPQDRTWPTQVEIPVGRQGKRLFFLGNVHGWSPGDEGVPPSRRGRGVCDPLRRRPEAGRAAGDRPHDRRLGLRAGGRRCGRSGCGAIRGT